MNTNPEHTTEGKEQESLLVASRRALRAVIRASVAAARASVEVPLVCASSAASVLVSPVKTAVKPFHQAVTAAVKEPSLLLVGMLVPIMTMLRIIEELTAAFNRLIGAVWRFLFGEVRHPCPFPRCTQLFARGAGPS